MGTTSLNMVKTGAIVAPILNIGSIGMAPYFLQHLGLFYRSPLEAAEEIMENPFDYKASEIHFRTELISGTKKAGLWIFADDGIGMSYFELDAALNMGNNKKRYGNAMGRFHSGLKAAMFKLGLRMEIYTVHRGGAGTFAILDYNEMIKNGNTNYSINQFTPTEWAIFDTYVPNGKRHGTVIVFSELVSPLARASDERKRFTTRFGQTYRHRLADPNEAKMYFCSSKKKTPIVPIDVIGWDLYPTCQKTSGKAKATFIENQVNYDWYYRVVFVSAADAKQLYDPTSGNPDPRSGARSGVYWIRENREILSADWDQLFGKLHTRYSHLNGFYVEVFLSNDFDPFLGLKITKNGINLSDSDASKRFRQHVYDTLFDQIDNAKKINSNNKKIIAPPPPSEVVQKENEHFCKKDMAKVERDLEGVPVKKAKKPGTGKKKKKTKNTGKKSGPRTKWKWILETVDDLDIHYTIRTRIIDQNTIRIELNSGNELVKYFNACQNSEFRDMLRGMFISQACGIMKMRGDEECEAAINQYRRTITYNNDIFMKSRNSP